MKYCDYIFYQSEYLGTMSKTLFNKLAIIASAEINKYTLGRISTKIPVVDEVKYCTCELVDYIKKAKKNEGKKSESVGNWSVNFVDKLEIKRDIYDIVKKYLSYIKTEDGTPLLYRGC
ncbi:MAG: hypothetical protein RSG48_03645 [Clostridia bacterium]